MEEEKKEEEVEKEEEEVEEEAAQKSIDDEGNERSQAADRVDIEIDDIEPDLHAPADDDDDDDDDDASPGDFTGEGPMKVLLEAVFKRLQAEVSGTGDRAVEDKWLLQMLEQDEYWIFSWRAKDRRRKRQCGRWKLR